MKILHYTSSPNPYYLTTTGAINNIASATVATNAKLSDANINYLNTFGVSFTR